MTLTTRQKVLLPLLLLTLVVLSWQVLPLLQAKTNKSAKATTPFQSRVKKSDRVNAGHLSKAMPKKASVIQVKTETQAHTPTSKPAFSKRQKEYLELANAYKISQMKRLIAEENQAIVVAKQRAAKAAVDTQTLLSKTKGQQSVEVTALDSQDKNAQYKLIYTGEQAGRWNATLKVQGHLRDILVGTVLPNDAEVVDINRDTVVIKQGNHKKIVSFYYTTDTVLKPVKATIAEAPQKSKAVRIQKKTIAVSSKQAVKSKQIVRRPVKKPTKLVKKKPLKKTLAKKSSIKPIKVVIKKPIKQPVARIKKPLKATRHYSAAEERLLKTPSKDYTIQLLANTRLSSIKKFIVENQLAAKTSYYRTSINGLPMYVLIYQKYTSSDDAVEGIASLPIQLQRYTPFIKSIKAVKSELRRVG